MSLSRYFVKPRPIPLLMSVVAIAVMFGLGVWQLQRLAWKEALMADIAQAVANEPMEGLPAENEEIADKRFYAARLRGHYEGQDMHLAARYYRSILGYSVFTPFQLDDGRWALVNRGSIPVFKKDDYPAAPKGPQDIKVQIRTSNERNPFTPENQPEKNIWFGRDTESMAEAAGVDALPFTFDVVGQQEADVYPVPSDGEIKLRNDHLGYAITWFGVGLGALVITLLYHRRKPEDRT